MKDFADRLSAFEELGARIAGVSPDSVQSHGKFSARLGITFPLLSDPEHGFIEQCGFWKKKKLYGKEYMGVERSTLLVDPQGGIARIFEKVKVEGHGEEVLTALQKLVS